MHQGEEKRDKPEGKIRKKGEGRWPPPEGNHPPVYCKIFSGVGKKFQREELKKREGLKLLNFLGKGGRGTWSEENA